LDPVTHVIAGTVISKLWFKKKWAMQVIVLSALLPDIDYISALFSPEAFFVYRRGITHGIAFMLLAPVLVSVIASKANGGRKPVRRHFEEYYYLSLIGILSHVFLDLFTPYGVRALAPFDARYYSFASVYYLDPVIALVLFAGFMVSRRKRKYAVKALAVALVICLVYLGGRTAIRHAAFSFARAKLDNYIVRSISPMPLSLWQWWYVARLADGSKRTGVIDLLAGNSYEAAAYPPDSRSSLAAVARRTRLASGFLDVFPDAHVEASKDGEGHTVVTFRALSYSFMNEFKFTVMVYLNSSGKVAGRKAVF